VFLRSRLIEVGCKGISIRRLGGDRAGEMRITRLLRNAKVSAGSIFSEAGAATASRCAGAEVVVIQDTTVLRSRGGGGLYAHCAIALEGESGAILGLVGATFLSRQSGKKADYKARQIEEKESARWLEMADRAAEIAKNAASLTIVADRESDIYAAFARRPARAHLVVRVAQDRALAESERLYSALDGAPEAGRFALDLPARAGRPKRTATMAVRFLPVRLKRPASAQSKQPLPASLDVHVADVREIDPPPGEALHWRLLTTRVIDSFDAALAVADLYRRRWAIEQYFRTLKSEGFQIETVDVADDEAFLRLAAAALVAGVAVQQLVHARDGGDGVLRPIADTFAPEDETLIETLIRRLEGKTAKQQNPHPKGSLARAAWVCARLGGWNCYYGKPGPITMLSGWRRFRNIKFGAALASPHLSVDQRDV